MWNVISLHLSTPNQCLHFVNVYWSSYRVTLAETRTSGCLLTVLESAVNHRLCPTLVTFLIFEYASQLSYVTYSSQNQCRTHHTINADDQYFCNTFVCVILAETNVCAKISLIDHDRTSHSWAKTLSTSSRSLSLRSRPANLSFFFLLPSRNCFLDSKSVLPHLRS